MICKSQRKASSTLRLYFVHQHTTLCVCAFKTLTAGNCLRDVQSSEERQALLCRVARCTVSFTTPVSPSQPSSFEHAGLTCYTVLSPLITVLDWAWNLPVQKILYSNCSTIVCLCQADLMVLDHSTRFPAHQFFMFSLFPFVSCCWFRVADYVASSPFKLLAYATHSIFYLIRIFIGIYRIDEHTL